MNSREGHLSWISATAAARLLGCTPPQIPRLARRGLISVRRLPGCDPRYLRTDVEDLAREATTAATSSTNPETECRPA